MTVAGLPAVVCPDCNSPYTVDMDGGLRFCPECRLEWNPSKPRNAADVLGPPPEIVAQVDADNVAALQDEQLAEAYLESLTGARVALKHGELVTVVGFGDDGDVLVRDDDGADAFVILDDIDHVVDADTPTSLDDIDLDDETAALVGDAVLTMACMAVEAGLASVVGSGVDAHLVEPPAGWIPDDVNAIPLIEQSAAVAVALLCVAFDLDRSMIAVAIDKIRPATREANDEKEQG